MGDRVRKAEMGWSNSEPVVKEVREEGKEWMTMLKELPRVREVMVEGRMSKR